MSFGRFTISFKSRAPCNTRQTTMPALSVFGT